MSVLSLIIPTDPTEPIRTSSETFRDGLRGIHPMGDVIIARAPFLGPGTWVMGINDWGAFSDPINRRAWALYGYSPVYGAAVLALDSGKPLPESIVSLLTETPFEDWPIPESTWEILMSDPERPRLP